LVVRAKPGVDEIRALRAWLKTGLRRFGLQCVAITPKTEEKAMDARKFASKKIKPDNVRESPIQSRLVNAFENERYGNLVLELENGSQFDLYEKNTDILIKAWGVDTDAWKGLELELYLGTYKDWQTGEDKETVRVRAISQAKTAEAQNGGAPVSKPLPPSLVTSSPKDMDDEIPF
jgi:hypothetical protein